MNRRIKVAILCLASALTASAQNYTDHLKEQRSGQGTVQVVESAAIDSLVNGTVAPTHVSPTETPKKPTTPKDTTHKRANEGNATEITGSDDAATTTETVVDNSRKVMRGKKVAGYRVQVFSGGNSREDKNKAQQTGNAMKEAFPTQPVFVHFYSPRWTCRIGNFLDRNDANECLRQVRALGYSQACIVKGTITVK